MPLRLPRDAYAIATVGDRVRVTERESGQLVDAGTGPVEIIESHAPF